MLRSYLLTLYRSLTRHRLFSALNILGLAVGLAVFLMLSIAVRFELSYDRWIPHADQTWRIDGVADMAGRPKELIGLVPGPVLPNLRAEFPQIRAGVRVLTGSMAVRRGEQADYEDVAFADPSFFDVFDLPLASGDRNRALADTSSVVISQAMARKYFGDRPALGERLTIVTDGTPRDFRVSGVLKDLPENTHLKLGFLARLDRSVLPDLAQYLEAWDATNYATYVRLSDPGAAEAVSAGLPGFMQRRSGQVGQWLQLKLEPLTAIHFNINPIGAFKPGVDRRFVDMLQVIGVLTLVLAVINYVNLSTARAALRAREVALRKVFGARREALMTQFLVEAVVVSLLAALIALALVELTLPLINTALGGSLRLHYLGEHGVLPMFVAVTAAVGVAAGFYPALVLSRFEPARVLAASRAPGGGRAAGVVRELLVLAQFAVSIALLICTGVVFAQSDFVRRADLGFQRDRLILVRQVGNPQVDPQKNVLLAGFRRLPGVVSVTVSGRFPGKGDTSQTSSFRLPGQVGHGASISLEPVGDRYFETYGMRLVAGRLFNPAIRMDDAAAPAVPGASTQEATPQQPMNVVLNEAATRALGFSKPAQAIGRVIRTGGPAVPLTVVGVVADARFGSPREKVPPLLYYRNTAGSAYLTGDPTIAVRYRGDPSAMIARLQGAWREVVPDVPFKAQTVESALGEFYRPDERRGLLVTLGTAVAALIGCLGLYGLAAFASERRTREIGIRKVLGASSGDVFRLLIGQFLRPVALANLIAWPVAFLLMREWLNSFDQHVDLTAVYFVAATTLAVGVALLTVSGQALRVARADPGVALREE